MIIAYLGMGANLGDPIQQLIDARRRISLLDGVIQLRSSSFYVSSPVGYQAQSDFVNCVIELSGDIDPLALFSAMQDTETALGRIRDPENQNAARHMDIDLLLFGDQKIETADLVVPHPRLQERLFVLLPLAELNKDLVVGEYGSVTQILHDGDFSDQKIMKLGC